MKEKLIRLIREADQALAASSDFRKVAQLRATRQSLIPRFFALGETEIAQSWLDEISDPLSRAAVELVRMFKSDRLPDPKQVHRLLEPFTEKDYIKISRSYLQAAWEYGNAKETEQAVEFSREAVRLNPGDVILIFQAATLLVSLERVEAAMQLLLGHAPFTLSITSLFVLSPFAEEMAKQQAYRDLWTVAGTLRRSQDREALFSKACKSWLAEGQIDAALQLARVPESPSAVLYEEIGENLHAAGNLDRLRELAALPTGHWPNGPARLIFFKHYCRSGTDEAYIHNRLLNSVQGAKKLPPQALGDNLPYLLEAALWRQMTELVSEILPLFPHQNAHQSFLRVLTTLPAEADPNFRNYLIQAIRGMAQALNPLQQDNLLISLEELSLLDSEEKLQEFRQKVISVEKSPAPTQRLVEFLLSNGKADIAAEVIVDSKENAWFPMLFSRSVGHFHNHGHPEIVADLLDHSPSPSETLKWAAKLLK